MAAIYRFSLAANLHPVWAAKGQGVTYGCTGFVDGCSASPASFWPMRSLTVMQRTHHAAATAGAEAAGHGSKEQWYRTERCARAAHEDGKLKQLTTVSEVSERGMDGKDGLPLSSHGNSRDLACMCAHQPL
jgi:hypothetical protein